MTKLKLKLLKGHIGMWLSNKWNLMGIYALCSTLMGIILYSKINFTELFLIYTLMGVCSLVVYVMGISRGMVIAYMERDVIDNILKKIIKKTDDNKE
jgi:hypothetical protein